MNAFKTAILLTLMMVLFMAIGHALGGMQGMYIMFIISLGMNFFSYWYSDKMVLKMYGAQQVDENSAPELVRMVANLAKKADLPMPKVYIMNTDVPNAFATGRNPSNAAVAATKGIMRALSYEELEGVLSHELAHVKHRDTLVSTVAATMAGAITMIGHTLQYSLMFGMGGRDRDNGSAGFIGQLAIMILAPLAAMLIQMGISRSREFMADEEGAYISGKPLALASALKKIESYAMQRPMPAATPATSNMFIINPLAGKRDMLNSLFSTHPATSARIERLEAIAQKMKNSR